MYGSILKDTICGIQFQTNVIKKKGQNPTIANRCILCWLPLQSEDDGSGSTISGSTVFCYSEINAIRIIKDESMEIVTTNTRHKNCLNYPEIMSTSQPFNLTGWCGYSENVMSLFLLFNLNDCCGYSSNIISQIFFFEYTCNISSIFLQTF